MTTYSFLKKIPETDTGGKSRQSWPRIGEGGSSMEGARSGSGKLQAKTSQFDLGGEQMRRMMILTVMGKIAHTREKKGKNRKRSSPFCLNYQIRSAV